MKVSIVVPTHNRRAQLATLIDSFVHQSATDGIAELIIVDDGSSDDTGAFLHAAETKELPFRLLVLRQDNKGPAAARNAGVRIATGDIVLFTGDDCLATSKLVERHLHAHRVRHQAVSILGHTTWDPKLETTPFMHFLENGGSQFAYWRISNPDNVGWSYYYTTNISTPRVVLDQHRFDERFKAARFEDMELGFRLALSGHHTVYEPRALTYHDHPTTLDEFRKRSRRFGQSAALFHELHPIAEIAQFTGVRDAKTVSGAVFSGITKAESMVKQLEPLIPPQHLHDAQCFGLRGTREILHACYRLLVHYELISGIRNHLNLPPLTPCDPGGHQ